MSESIDRRGVQRSAGKVEGGNSLGKHPGVYSSREEGLTQGGAFFSGAETDKSVKEGKWPENVGSSIF